MRCLIPVTAALLVACTTSGTPQSVKTPARTPLRLLSSRGDTVSVVGEREAPGLVVKRERGIGGATLEVVGRAWPEELPVDLEGFHNLESFVICSGDRCVETDLRSAPRARVRDGAGERWSTEVEMPIRLLESSIRVEVPAAALAGESTRLDLRWVDEYR